MRSLAMIIWRCSQYACLKLDIFLKHDRVCPKLRKCDEDDRAPPSRIPRQLRGNHQGFLPLRLFKIMMLLQTVSKSTNYIACTYTYTGFCDAWCIFCFDRHGQFLAFLQRCQLSTPLASGFRFEAAWGEVQCGGHVCWEGCNHQGFPG